MSLSGWSSNKKIKCTIAAADIGSNMTNFPALVNIAADHRPDSVADDFTGTDGDAPDSLLWDDTDSDISKIRIAANQLKLSTSSETAEYVIHSKYKLTGDFDVQIDFAEDVHPLTDVHLAGVLLSNEADDWTDDAIGVDARVSASLRRYWASIRTAGTWAGGDFTRSQTSGKMRIVRSGSTGTIYYWNGSAWAQLTTGACPTDDFWVHIRILTSTNITCSWLLDNFTVNSGTVVWPDSIPGGSGKTSFDNADIFDELTPLDVDDDFTGINGDAPDVRLWSQDTEAAFRHLIASNKLHTIETVNAGTVWARTKSLFILSGDFDVQIDVSAFSTTTTSGDVALLEFVAFDNVGSNYFGITRSGYNVSTEYMTAIDSDSLYENITSTLTSFKFRLTRVGSVLKVYYWSGSQWEWDGSTAGKTCNETFTADVKIWISSRCDVDCSLAADFDNFTINSGTVVWPNTPKKLAFEIGDTGVQCFGEIVTWDYAGKSAQLHVNIPSVLAAVNSILYLYYDASQQDNDLIRSLFSIDDDFTGTDGDVPDELLWYATIYSGDTCEIQSNKLYIESVNNTSTTNITSKHSISGDFSLQVDFSSYSTATDDLFDLQVYSDVNNDAYIRARNSGGTSQFYGKEKVAGVSGSAASAARTNTYGTLIFVRSGSTLIAKYKDGGGSETTLYSRAIFTTKVIVIIRVSSPTGTFSVSADNFLLNSGTILPRLEDDFTGTDGDAPRTDLWKVINSSAAGTAQINSNKLRVSIPSVAADEKIELTSFQNLSGDFDIQLDYDEVSHDPPSAGASTLLAFYVVLTSGNYFLIGTTIDNASNYYYSRQSVADGYGSTTAHHTSGKLRVVRSGSTITIYYWSGTQWEWNSSTAGHSFTDSDSSDLNYVLLRVEAGVNSGVTTDIDNFKINYAESITGYIGDTGEVPAQNVWDANFVAVYHMAQDPSGGADCILDSTSNTNHGTPNGTMTSGDLIDGVTGKVIEFDGVDDFINIGDVFNPTYMTLECLFSTETIGTNAAYALIVDKYSSYVEGALYLDGSDSHQLEGGFYNASWKILGPATGSLNDGDYHYGALSYDGAYLRLYADSDSYAVAETASIVADTTDWRIGARWDAETEGGWWPGKIGEVRLSDIRRSDDWLAATNKSLTDALITFSTTLAIIPKIFSLLYGDYPVVSQFIKELYNIGAIPKKFVEQYALVEEKEISIPTGWSSRVKLIVDPDKISSTQNGFMALVYLDQSVLFDAVKRPQSNPVRSIAENLRVYIATDGNDDHGDGSAEYPYQTVEKGLSMVPEDGQLLLYPGTYNHDAARFTLLDANLYLTSTTGHYQDVTIVLGTQEGFTLSGDYHSDLWVENLTIESNCTDHTFYSSDEIMRFYNVFLNYTGTDTNHHWGKGTQIYNGYLIFYNCTIKVGVGDVGDWTNYTLYNSICDDAVDAPYLPGTWNSCFPGSTGSNNCINYTTNPPGFPSADSAVISLSSPCVNAGSQSYQSWWDGDNPDIGVHEVGSPYSRLCFTKADGSLLPVEIIAWDEDNNRAVFYIDINIDASYATFVYVYYTIIPISGNSPLLNASNSLSYWSEYESVIHGVINSDGDVEDSAIIGSITTSPTFNVNYYVNTPYGPGLNLAYSAIAHLLVGDIFDKTAGTLVVVFNTDNTSVTQVLFATPASAITNQHKFEITTAGAIQITDAGGTTSVSTTTGFNDGEYHTLVITWNASGRIVEVGKVALTISNPTATFVTDPSSAVGLIGYDYVSKDSSADSFDGIISEFRLSKSAFASGAIRTVGYSETDTLFDATVNADNSILESYGAGPRLAAFVEEWIITAGVTPNWFIEPWVIMQPPNIQVFEEIWGIKLLNTIVEVWGDVAKKKATFVEWWGDGAIPINWFSELYDDAKQRRAVYSLLWRIHSNPQAFIVEDYAITETVIKNFFVENYALKDRNAVLSVKTLLYHLLDEGSTVTQPEASVLIATGSGTTPDVVPDASTYQGLDFVSIQINGSLGQYCLSCDVVVPNEAQYSWCQYQDAVILNLGGTEYVFFVESRERTISIKQTSYSIGLLSPTAKLDTPYSKTIVDPLNSGTMAKALVEEMAALKNITVDWQILDWMIPGYAISINDETPLVVIKKVVNSVGAVVQTKPNGDMLIISKYPISVPQWDTATPVAVFTTLEDINQFSETLDVKDGFNAFQITDQGSSSESISLEVVDGEGTAKIVKGYQVPFDVDNPFPLETSGQPGVSIDRYTTPIDMQIPIQEEDDDPEWEVVEFIDHVGTTSLPIYEVVEFEWITDELGDVADLGAFQVSEDGTLSVIDTDSVPGESLLRIKYMTKYWQWTVTGPLDRPVQFYVPDSFFQEIGS